MDMRAIVDIKGKQYEIEEGRYVRIDRYAAEENEEVLLGNVCMIVAGEQSLIGAPYVSGATVKATVKRHGRGPKILVYKMRCKKGYRRKNGYRDDFTELQIVTVDFPGREAIASKPEEASTASPATGKTSKPKRAAAKPEPNSKTADAASAKTAPKEPVSKAKAASKQDQASAIAETPAAVVTSDAPALESSASSAPAAGETSPDGVE